MGIFVNKMVDADVDAKIDTDYVSTHLPDLPNLAVTFVCTDDDRFKEGDDWISPQDGVRHIVIKLPYKMVKRRRDVRVMMLAMVVEKLQEAAPTR